jgi:UDP-glucose 4-epimerase
MAVLVTGGAGFIGSHTCAELLRRGHEVVIVDDHSNSSPAALDAIREVSGRGVTAYPVDLRDQQGMNRAFRENQIDAVIHFAAKKHVRESMRIPLNYYGINVGGTVNLVETMLKYDVRRLVFSSSCSIYGNQYKTPISEEDQPGPTNPYARSKLMCEQILSDACRGNPELSVAALRYFNPIGAHPSGAIGENPTGVPSNVLPVMMQVALGQLDCLEVYGDDYDTPDGSGVRDYIHVVDVAEAHCVALDHLDDEPGMQVFNLGTGKGVSVLQLLATFEEVTGEKVQYRIVGRQPGDVAMLIADPTRVEKIWGWQTSRDLPVMCRDAWHFQSLHPGGY